MLKAIAGALNMSAESLLKQAGLLEEDGGVDESAPTTEKAIAATMAR